MKNTSDGVQIVVSREGQNIFASGIPGAHGTIHANADGAEEHITRLLRGKQKLRFSLAGDYGVCITHLPDPTDPSYVEESWGIPDARSSVSPDRRIIILS